MSDSQTEQWNVLRLLEWTTEFFTKRGSDSARLDAEILLAHAKDCTRIELYTAFNEVPSEEVLVAFRELVRRRGDGSPVAQLVGYREFYSLRFRVDESVLIPRPETEHLVIEALDCAKEMKVTDRPLQIADVGTGSGAIAISLAKNLSSCHLTATDLSEAALNIAAWNAEHHKCSQQIDFVHCDLMADVAQTETFDIICSNPPYISEAEYEQLSPTVKDYEPKSALVAEADGTEVIKRLFGECFGRLNPGGRMIIELSPMIADACADLAEQVSDLADQRFINDLAGHKRILSLGRS